MGKPEDAQANASPALSYPRLNIGARRPTTHKETTNQGLSQGPPKMDTPLYLTNGHMDKTFNNKYRDAVGYNTAGL